MRHVHLLDPQLQGNGGHYLTHDAQLVRALHDRQLPVSLYARRNCSVTCEGLTPEKAFTLDIFQEAASDPQVWAMENFHTINQAFLADLLQIPLERFTSDDLIYFPNILQNQLHAVALWLGRMPAERRPAVAVMLRYLNHAMDYVQARPNKELIALQYRFAAKALYAAQPRSIICADTRELAAAYQKIIGLPVLELPNPMDVSSRLAAPSNRNASQRPTIVYQGHTSPLRGMHFLPDIIEQCAKLPVRPRFVIQVQSREAAAQQLGPTLARLEKLSNDDVRLVFGALEDDAYYAMLHEADLILLPYAPTFYGYGSSGVFTEAASLGKVVTVTAGTVPARQGREYGLGVTTAAQWNAPSFVQAIAATLRDLPVLQAKAAAAAPRFRAEQCAPALWQKLLAAFEAVAKARAGQAAA